tara:strand:+ start:5856 stop:6215 length:360 start_codon:yes stop_codon:yes gene_type:complete
MDGFLAHRRADPRYASERGGRVEVYSNSYYQPGITRSIHKHAMADKPKKKKSDDSDSDSSDDEGGGGKKRIYRRGEDADGDGITNEAAKNKVTDFSSKDGDDIPDAFQKKKKKKEKNDD